MLLYTLDSRYESGLVNKMKQGLIELCFKYLVKPYK